jgi:hypothetical protein
MTGERAARQLATAAAGCLEDLAISLDAGETFWYDPPSRFTAPLPSTAALPMTPMVAVTGKSVGGPDRRSAQPDHRSGDFTGSISSVNVSSFADTNAIASPSATPSPTPPPTDPPPTVSRFDGRASKVADASTQLDSVAPTTADAERMNGNEFRSKFGKGRSSSAVSEEYRRLRAKKRLREDKAGAALRTERKLRGDTPGGDSDGGGREDGEDGEDSEGGAGDADGAGGAGGEGGVRGVGGQGGLPAGWVVLLDDNTSKPYYSHVDGTTTWVRPLPLLPPTSTRSPPTGSISTTASVAPSDDPTEARGTAGDVAGGKGCCRGAREAERGCEVERNRLARELLLSTKLSPFPSVEDVRWGSSWLFSCLCGVHKRNFDDGSQVRLDSARHLSPSTICPDPFCPINIRCSNASRAFDGSMRRVCTGGPTEKARSPRAVAAPVVSTVTSATNVTPKRMTWRASG